MHNIFPSPSSVSNADRQFLNGHSGGLLWFTGLSGSGKSAPYEEPEHPSIIIETDKLDLQQCVDEVIKFLLKQKLISAVSQPEFDGLGEIKS